MTKTVSFSFPEEIESKLEDVEDAFEAETRSHVIRRIIKEYHSGKNSYKYLIDDKNE